jgi:hypothetical protein
MNYGNLLWKTTAGAAACFLLVSCAAQAPVSPFSPVYVTNSAFFMLLPAAEIEKSIDGPQQMTGNYGGAAFVLTAYVRADETGIDMAFFNDLGADMGNFSFNGQAVSFHSPVFPSQVKAEYLAADFQFCFYRPEALRQALAGQNLGFELLRAAGEDGADREIRRISGGRETIIEIEKTAGYIRYTNFLRGYAYTIQGAL